MLGYIELLNADDVAIRLHGGLPQRRVTNTAGLPGVDLAGTRESVLPRPAGPGTINRSRFLGEDVITIDGYVKGVSAAAAQADLRIVKAALYDSIATDRVLRYQVGDDGPELMTAVRLGAGGLTVVPDGAFRVMRYQASLRADEPRAFGLVENSVDSSLLGLLGGGLTFPITFPFTFTPGAAGQVFIATLGSVPTPPIFRLHGELLNPVIRHEDGSIIDLQGVVEALDYIDVDVAAREVRNSDGALRNSYVKWQTTTWFELPASSLIQLTATSASGTAYMTVTYRDAYV